MPEVSSHDDLSCATIEDNPSLNPSLEVRVFMKDAVFLVSRQTLIKRDPESLFAKSLSLQPPQEGVISELVFDRSPRHFVTILGYLRTGRLPSLSLDDLNALEVEAKFFAMARLLPVIRNAKSAIQNQSHKVNATLTSKPSPTLREASGIQKCMIPKNMHLHNTTAEENDDLMFKMTV